MRVAQVAAEEDEVALAITVVKIGQKVGVHHRLVPSRSIPQKRRYLHNIKMIMCHQKI